jgi:putative oxidoreductase
MMFAGIVQGMISLTGRLFLVTVFLLSAVGNKIPQFSAVVTKMKAVGIPYPEIALGGAIVFLIVGSLTVLTGYMARIGATLLLIFLCLATYYFHNFWVLNPQHPAFEGQMIQFMKNLGLAGAMLMIIANGPGVWSLGGKPAGKK